VVKQGFPFVILGIILASFGFRRWISTPSGRYRMDAFKLKAPVFGPLFHKLAMSRFSRNLGLLLNVGVPVMQALSVVGETTGNEVINVAMKDVQAAVRDGQPMSSALRHHKIFPEMVTQMIEVGEESGQISQMLDKVADFYDREVDSAAESLTASIEPIMVLVMGAVVGGMVICLYLPMFTIYQNIQST
jgi:type IV pilus assembly protein PilC